MTKITHQLTLSLNNLLKEINTSYENWHYNRNNGIGSASSERMINDFKLGLKYKIGKKYVKIIAGAFSSYGRAWGFVALEDFGKFKRGDILKANSWNHPALNQPRGNIFNDLKEQKISWLGTGYLK